MLTLSTAIETLRPRQILRLCTVWKITRVDGTIFRFTDHNQVLTIGANDYTPVGGFDATARQKKVGTERAPNLDIRGIVSSDTITESDLRAGLFRNALVRESLVDWKYPWLGRFRNRHYNILETTHSNNGWEATMEGVAAKLKQNAGRTLQRRCHWDLGQPIASDGPGLTGGCGVTLSSFSQTGQTVTSVNSNDRRDFDASGMSSQSDHYYRHGIVTWLTGDNAGLSFEVQGYTNSGRRVWCWLDAPSAIQVGDTFDIVAGCDKERSTCRDKFSNIVNFGGFPWVPGGDKATATPNVPDD